MTRPLIVSQSEFRRKFEEYVNKLTPEQAKQHGQELQAFASEKASRQPRLKLETRDQ